MVRFYLTLLWTIVVSKCNLRTCALRQPLSSTPLFVLRGPLTPPSSWRIVDVYRLVYYHFVIMLFKQHWLGDFVAVFFSRFYSLCLPHFYTFYANKPPVLCLWNTACSLLDYILMENSSEFLQFTCFAFDMVCQHFWLPRMWFLSLSKAIL